jgi:hypothetical protein
LAPNDLVNVNDVPIKSVDEQKTYTILDIEAEKWDATNNTLSVFWNAAVVDGAVLSKLKVQFPLEFITDNENTVLTLVEGSNTTCKGTMTLAGITEGKLLPVPDLMTITPFEFITDD